MNNEELLHCQFNIEDMNPDELNILVHNHGFVRLVRFMGGDATPVQSARVSYGNGTKSLREDLKLLKYLIVHQHWSPFEQVSVVFHMKMPIFVARQFVRHRMAKLNEMSGRYSVMPEEWYCPDADIETSTGDVWLPGQDTKNKQGSNGLVKVSASVFGDWLKCQEDAFEAYHSMLEAGVSRELSRSCLPLGTYTEWYWQMDLRNLLHFFDLRCDAHAQKEARDYADAMKTLTKLVVPHTMDIWQELKGSTEEE